MASRLLSGSVYVMGCSAEDDSDVNAMAAQLIPLLKEGLSDPAHRSHLKGIKGVFQLNLMQNNKKAGSWYALFSVIFCIVLRLFLFFFAFVMPFSCLFAPFLVCLTLT